MRRIGSKLAVALVCSILGFMLAYQFKMLNRYNNGNSVPNDSTDLTVEIEQYKKEKDDLNKQINQLQDKIKGYENTAASSNEAAKEILDELNNDRMVMGSVDVHGQGIIVYLTPKTGVFQNNDYGPPITDDDIISIVNELNSVDAEAISINGIRITSRSGIRNAGNYIYVNEEKISPWNMVTIEAIGDSAALESTLDFPDAIPEMPNCDVKIEKSNDIKITKYNKVFKFKYAKAIK